MPLTTVVSYLKKQDKQNNTLVSHISKNYERKEEKKRKRDTESHTKKYDGATLEQRTLMNRVRQMCCKHEWSLVSTRRF